MMSAVEPAPLWRTFAAMAVRELGVKCRRPGEWVHPIAFFIIVVTLFPLGVSPEPKVLSTLAPGVIWVAALLAMLLSLDGLFRQDFEDGTLEQWLMAPVPDAWLVFAKLCVHWLSTGLPLALISPFLGVMLGLPLTQGWPLLASLMVGTLCLSGLGAVGAALTVGLRHNGVLLSLLMLPLYVPILILGAGTLRLAQLASDVTPPLAALSAACLTTMALAPFVTGFALRLSIEGR